MTEARSPRAVADRLKKHLRIETKQTLSLLHAAGPKEIHRGTKVECLWLKGILDTLGEEAEAMARA